MMKQVSNKENISFEKLTGIMTLDAARILKNSAGTASAVGKTGYELFDEMVLDSYRNTLEKISEQGAEFYLQQHLGPFLNSAQAHFDPKQKTIIETFIGRVKLKLFRH